MSTSEENKALRELLNILEVSVVKGKDGKMSVMAMSGAHKDIDEAEYVRALELVSTLAVGNGRSEEYDDGFLFVEKRF